MIMHDQPVPKTHGFAAVRSRLGREISVQRRGVGPDRGVQQAQTGLIRLQPPASCSCHGGLAHHVYRCDDVGIADEAPEDLRSLAAARPLPPIVAVTSQ